MAYLDFEHDFKFGVRPRGEQDRESFAEDRSSCDLADDKAASSPSWDSDSDMENFLYGIAITDNLLP